MQSHHQPDPWPLLENVTRPTVGTDQAAFYLNRKAQTLREWSSKGGPIRPRRVHGRLAWPIEDIRELLGV